MSAPRRVKHDEQRRKSVGDAFHAIHGIDVHDGLMAGVFGPLFLRRWAVVFGRFRIQWILHKREKILLLAAEFVIDARLAVIKVFEGREPFYVVSLADGIVFGAIDAGKGHFGIVSKFRRRRREVRLQKRKNTDVRLR